MKKLELRPYQKNTSQDAKTGSGKTAVITAEKQIDVIRKKCEDAGLNIYQVFREAKVPIVTVSNWTRKEPDAFTTIVKIEAAIEKLTAEKETDKND